MTLAKAKAKTNETFIVQASLTIITYDRKNMFIVQATEELLSRQHITFMSGDIKMLSKVTLETSLIKHFTSLLVIFLLIISCTPESRWPSSQKCF